MVAEKLVLRSDGTAEHSYRELEGQERYRAQSGLWYLARGDSVLCFQPVSDSALPDGLAKCRAFWFDSDDNEEAMHWGIGDTLSYMGFERDSYREHRDTTVY